MHEMKIDPYSAIQFYCPECESPLHRTPDQFRENQPVKCLCCGHEFSPDAEELIDRKQKLFDDFEEYKKRLNEQN